MIENSMPGPGGAPTRATTFPNDAQGRKARPVATGVLDYFPDAFVALAEVSWHGNEQHNPGQSMRWDRAKSGDEADALMRHFMQRGLIDHDGVRHTAKMVWRALALLQKEIEVHQGVLTGNGHLGVPGLAGTAFDPDIRPVVMSARERDDELPPF